MNTCLQVCAKRKIYAGGDRVFLADRLVRFDFGGMKLLESGETVPDEYPPPQFERAFAVEEVRILQLATC